MLAAVRILLNIYQVKTSLNYKTYKAKKSSTQRNSLVNILKVILALALAERFPFIAEGIKALEIVSLNSHVCHFLIYLVTLDSQLIHIPTKILNKTGHVSCLCQKVEIFFHKKMEVSS